MFSKTSYFVLRQVMAGADGIVKLYETIDSIKLKQWQLQVLI
jgi:hypothetical protein